MSKRNAFSLIELGIVLLIILCLCALMLYLNPPCRIDYAYYACKNGELAKLKLLATEGKIDRKRLPHYLTTTAMWGHFDICRYLVEELNAPLTHDELLFYAIGSEDRRILPYLLEAGVPIDVKARHRNRNSTLLHISAACGNKSFCKKLLELGAEVDAVNDEQETPLQMAAKNGHEEIFYLFVDAGAKVDVRAKGNRGGTLLHYAAEGGSAKICNDLILRGADLHAKTDFGVAPIHCAASARDPGACRVLIEAGANVESPSTESSNDSSPIELSLRWNTEKFKLLVDAGAKYDVHRVYSYDTLLQFAVSHGDLELCKKFVEEGADKNQNIRGGWTLLHYAARSGSAEVCAWLLEDEFDLEARATYDRTPLHIAADALKLETCRFLVEAGANSDARDCFGKTPLDIIITDERRVDKTALIEFFRSLQADRENVGPVPETDADSD